MARMREIAAVIVIILISISSTTSANKRLDLDLYDDIPIRSTQSIGNKGKDDKVQAVEKDEFYARGCPLCDASVYSYCDYKIYHDACCCGLQAPQCAYNDCSFLHANSCQEHQLITKCCCYNPYRNI